MIGPGIIFLLLVIASTITVYLLIRTRHIENMAKIEHGIIQEEKTSMRSLLHLGLFLCFLGVGCATAFVLSEFSGVPESVAFPACLLFFGGLGLILSYVITVNARR